MAAWLGGSFSVCVVAHKNRGKKKFGGYGYVSLHKTNLQYLNGLTLFMRSGNICLVMVFSGVFIIHLTIFIWLKKIIHSYDIYKMFVCYESMTSLLYICSVTILMNLKTI